VSYPYISIVDLFGPGEGNAFNLDPTLWPIEESITDMENYDLSKPFTEEEIKEVQLQMEKNKAAGQMTFLLNSTKCVGI
jgi:hypothetical protein